MLARLRHRLRDLFERRRLEADLDEELRGHIEAQIAHYRDAGLDTAEARRRARAEFGSLEAIKDDCRDVRSTRLLDTVRQDVRHGLRLLVRYPLFATTAVATLGLSIAGTSILFTLVHTFFLQPLPVGDGASVVRVVPTQDDGANTGPISYPDFVHLRDNVTRLSALAAIYPTAPLFVTGPDGGFQFNGAVVSANFFEAMALEPARGRFFAPNEDEVPDRDRVAVISHAFWHSWFGGRSSAVGASLRVNGEAFTVVGVAPRSFSGVGAEPIAIFLPTMMLPVGYRWCEDALGDECTVLRMYGRLAPGASIATATAELDTLLPPAWREPAPGANSGLAVERARGVHLSDVDRRFLVLLGWAMGALLLVCCANLAGLLVARGKAREAEMGMRRALGASYGRLVQQLLIESVTVALGGALLGLALATGMTRVLAERFFAFDSSGRPLAYDFGVQPQVVGVVVAVAVFAGVAFGLAPALLAARATRRLPEGGHRSTGSRSRGAAVLIVGQAAAAVVLAVTSILLLTSAGELVSGRGFEPGQVALLRLRPRLLGWSPAEAQPYLRSALASVEDLPDVESASFVGTGIAILGLTAAVETTDPEPRAGRFGYLEVSGGYFETLGVPIVRGRGFAAADDAGHERAAVLSVAAAARLWPGSDPIGQTLRVNDALHTVVGVAADVHLASRADRVRPYVYTSFWANPDHVDARLQVRVKGDPDTILPSLARSLHAVDPEVPISETLSLERRLEGLFRPQRLAAAAVSYSGALAVVLAAIGLYASLAAAVDRRRREIGIRQAVGSSRTGVLALIAGEGVRLLGTGIATGSVLAIAAIRVLAPVLYAPASGDVRAIIVAGLAVFAAGLLATLVPARRATRVDPMEVLRAD